MFENHRAGERERSGDRDSMRDVRRVIPAGSSEAVAVEGSFISVKTVTGEGPFQIDVGGSKSELVSGDLIRFSPSFSQFRIYNSGSDVMIVKLLVGFGDFRRNAVPAAPTMTDELEVAINNGTVSPAILSNGDRKAIYICSLAANTGPLRVGPGATGSRGLELNPGETLILETKTGIRVANFSGAVQTYAIAELYGTEA